jgi:hypothetical protein
VIFLAKSKKRKVDRRNDLIVAMFEQRKSYAEIAKAVGMSRSGVQGVIYKYKTGGLTFDAKKKEEARKVSDLLGFLYDEYDKLQDERNRVFLLGKFSEMYTELSKTVMKMGRL